MLYARIGQTLQRILQACKRLRRQAVNQIRTDARKASFACQRQRFQRLLCVVNASYRPQLVILQRLYAEADAVKAKAAQCLQLGQIRRAGVHLNRCLAGLLPKAVLLQCIHQLSNTFRRQHARRTAAKVNAGVRRHICRLRRTQVDFFAHSIGIITLCLLAKAGIRSKIAVQAFLYAKRYMQIKRLILLPWLHIFIFHHHLSSPYLEKTPPQKLLQRRLSKFIFPFYRTIFYTQKRQRPQPRSKSLIFGYAPGN